jgi:3-deoxy-D-manno-octulosonic-acid transferase
VAVGGAAYNLVFPRWLTEAHPSLYLLYSVLLALGFVLALPVFLWRGRASGKYVRTFKERMGRLPASLNAAGDRSIWVHAVSVGEVLAARPLVLALKERFPSLKVFVSTTTLTGNAVAQKSEPGTDGLFFAPFDWRGPVRRVLDRINPALLVLVETEIWPNLLHEARRRGVRVAIVNGRISPRSHRGYVKIRPFLRHVLGEVDLFLMQGEAHAARIREMGAKSERVRVTGNLKFDSVEAPSTSETLRRLLDPAGRRGRPLFVAGSTAAGEEELVLEAISRVRTRIPEAGLVIAPRHPERFDAVFALIEARGFRGLRRSTLEPGAWTGGEVVVLDSLGELAQVYPLAEVVFVGGSLVPVGGHNILEAAVAGKPVLVGPHMHNFQEMADRFRAEGALLEVHTGAELGEVVASLLEDERRRRALGERGRVLVESHRGAVAATVEALAGLLA